MTLKNILLPFTVCLLISSSASAQCESAEIVNWQMTSTLVDTIADQTYEIQIDAPGEVESYSLSVYSEYELIEIGSAPLTHVEQDGSLVPGMNTIEVTIPANSINDLSSTPVWHYFSVDFQTNCANGENSGTQKFYLSSHSLLNDPGFQCGGQFFTVASPIPDDQVNSFEAFLPVDMTDNQSVDSLSVFLDLGHTYIGDLVIELESPSGTSTILFNQIQFIGNAHSISVVFQDGAPSIESFASMNDMGPRGFFSPENPLSVFQGEPSAGVWKITINDLWGFDDGLWRCLYVNQ